jgi:hypothetical protein
VAKQPVPRAALKGSSKNAANLRLTALAVELLWAGADLRQLDFLRWLVHSGQDPEWRLSAPSTAEDA